MFTDAIIFVPAFFQLVAHLDVHHPHLLARDEDNNLVMPPVVQGFARTPAVVNGDRLLAYMRLTEEQAEQWRGTPGVEILSEAPYTGRETGNKVYEQLFADAEATAKYDSVYDRSPRTYTDPETGEEYQAWPPVKFGVMA